MNKRKGSGVLQRLLRPLSGYRITLLLWVALVVFFLLIFSFPRWITFFYPLPHHDYIVANAARYDVDPYLVFAIIRAESEFKAEAESARGARGLMQIMPDTGHWIAQKIKIKDFQEEDLLDPELNIRMGCWYLSDLDREFAGRLPLVVAAYNAGRGNVKKWLVNEVWDGQRATIDKIPFPETRNYVKLVLTDYEIYHLIYAQRGHRQ